MKYLYSIIFSISFFIGYAQSASGTNNLDSTATWRIRFNEYIEPTGNYVERQHHDYEYVLGKDTVVFQKRYKKLLLAYYKDYSYFYAQGNTYENSKLDTVYKWVGLYREDSGRYYVLKLNNHNGVDNSFALRCKVPGAGIKEYLVADMNLELDDTINLGENFNSRIDSLIFKVTEIDSVYTGWDYRKRIILRRPENDFLVYIWIEGVGPISLGGPFGADCYVFEESTNLFCWEIQDSESKMVFPEPCRLLDTEFKGVGIKELDKSELHKTGKNTWKINGQKNYNYKLYQANGTLIENGQSENGEFMLTKL